MAEKLDVVVIGGGPGGYVAGIRSAQLGKKTAVVESTHLGGICLNWGCIPTKALLHTAELYESMRRAEEFGLKVGEIGIDWLAVIERSRDVANRLSKGIEFLFNKYGVTYYPGRGKLASAKQVIVEPQGAQAFQVEAANIIIATGARPKAFPGMEPDGERVITSKEAMVLPEVPKRMVIIGAGAIGVEFAYFYNVFGTEVTIIEMLPQILPMEDEDISKELARQFKKRKINILTGTKVDKIERQKTQVKVHTSGNSAEVVTADLALVAVGVQGNVEDLGLEKVGIKVEKGMIQVDERYRTAAEGVYAIGDVIGPPLLAHAASAEGLTAVEHLAGMNPAPLNPRNIPACTYCHPQVASVGYTEKEAKEAGYEVKVGKFPFRALGKALATGEIDGFVKVIYDGEYGELLGAHMIGDGATDLISETAVARTLETTHHEILKTVHPHPTLSEAIMEATAVAQGEAVNY
ncbi:MAG: dihydrolipoyl dehydrogenase [Fidelibacterota bacterium]|nr:MAG: dihydrolipoyl dehydrogenase [Candidatus Neomarinimicrobiota bacterium]